MFTRSSSKRIGLGAALLVLTACGGDKFTAGAAGAAGQSTAGAAASAGQRGGTDAGGSSGSSGAGSAGFPLMAGTGSTTADGGVGDTPGIGGAASANVGGSASGTAGSEANGGSDATGGAAAGGGPTGTGGQRATGGSDGAGGSSVGTGGSTQPDLLPLADACTLGAQCESGYCADGVCCDTSCANVCSACNVAGSEGSCNETQRDAACGDLECPEDTECRTYELVDDTNCEGVGLCAASASCTHEDVASGTSCQSSAGTCTGTGECFVPNKAVLGENCAGDDDCGSGFCAATASGGLVCCSEACAGVCEACGADGYCDDAPADDSRCDSITCAPDTICTDYPAALNANRCAGAGQCITEAAHCQPVYADSTVSCGSGIFCDGAGNCEDACTAAQLWCTDSCIDPSIDEQNCGGCGVVCPDTSSCESGICECPGASELLCSDVCVDVSRSVDSCGSCYNDCPTPTQAGSSAVCVDGNCDVCGAYSQDCCSGLTCGGGLICSGSSCSCQVGSHYCSSGLATGECASDADINNCGPTCYDCEQPNAIAYCSSGSCANSCAPTVSTLCAPASDGKANCGGWNFESNTVEGWAYDTSLTPSRHAGGSAPTTAAMADQGTYSLAVHVDTTDIPNGRAIVRVPLCTGGQPLDVLGKRFSASILYVSDSDSPPLADAAGGANYWGFYSGDDTFAAAGSGFNVDQTTGGSSSGGWFHFSQAELTSTMFMFYPTVPTAATHLAFSVGYYPWKGTVYIDNVRISD